MRAPLTLTRRGAALLGTAAALFASGRLLGLAELYIIATTIVLLVAGSATWTASRPSPLAAQRTLTERLQVGVVGRVDLLVANDGRQATPTLSFTDQFDGGRRAARFMLAPLGAGVTARAAYRVPTERRGRFELGPLTAALGDPFGLTQRSWRAASTQEVIVYPRVFDVLPLPELGGDGIDTDSRDVAGRFDVSGEFHTLREYGPSDDLRRVHWKSTARRDQLMVRQDETRRRAPVLVLLDVRVTAHDRASFERAVEATASIVAALERAGRPVEVVTSSGRVIGQQGQRHLANVLDELAVIEPDGPDRIVPALTGRRARALVAITGALRPNDLGALDLIVRRRGGLALVVCHGTAPAVAPRPGRRTFVCGTPPDVDFPTTWNEALLQWQRHDRSALLSSRSRLSVPQPQSR